LVLLNRGRRSLRRKVLTQMAGQNPQLAAELERVP
jgi:hypothetical protein